MRSARTRAAWCWLLLALTSLPAAAEEDADALLARARATYSQQGPRPALPLYEQALAAYRASGDRHGEAVTLGLMGNCYKRFGEYDRALELLGEALERKRELGDRSEEAATLSHLGLVFWELGDYRKALERFEASREIARQIGDAKLEGINLNNISLVHDELGDYERSLEQYGRALEVYRGIDFPRGESDTLGNMGGVHLLLGRYREALDLYRRSLAISEREGLKHSMSLDLGNIALCELGLGRIDEALAHFDRAIELTREAGTTQDEAYWLKGKGQALVEIGRYDEGLGLLREAVERYQRMGARGEMIEALNELGALYGLLGDIASAEDRFQRAVEIARETGNARGVTYNLLALGEIEWRRQHFERAVAIYQEARRRAEEAQELGLTARALLRLAASHRQQGLDEVARDEVERALGIARQIGAPSLEARALFSAAEGELRAGRFEPALELFGQAEARAVELGDPDLLWRIRHGRGRALDRRGSRPEAVAALEAAVSVIEAVRGRLREERFRAGYLEDKYQVYVDLVRVLLEMGRVEEAFGTAERLRAHGYLELVRRKVPVEWTEEQRLREAELRERVRRLERTVAEERDRVGSEYRQRAMAVFSAELSEAESEYQAFLDDVRGTDPAAVGPLSVPSSSRVRASLPGRTALVEYVVADDSLFVFVVSADGVRSKVIPATPRDLEARVELLRDLIQETDSEDWRRPAASLAARLIWPIEEAGWLEGVSHLYLVPHGILHYVPFAALPMARGEGSPLLVESLELSLLPAAAMLVERRRPIRARGSLLALAPESPGLRYAPEEVRGVGGLFGADRKLLIGARARESAFKELAGSYRIIHLASHGYFNRINPLLSGIQLGEDPLDDGRLEVHEILDLRLGADLVALSACDTGLSSGHFAEVPAGEDFVGLTRAFLHAGSDAVLATLWRVDDRSTVELMQGFYRQLGSAHSSGALARAQRAGLAGERYRHPFYWAPFVLVGPGGEQSEPRAENRAGALVQRD